MTKFNVTVELDWFDEEGSLDEQLKDEIAKGIINRVSSQAIADVEKKVQAKIAEIDAQIIGKTEIAISEKLAECLEDFLNKPRTITNEWGEAVRKDVTVIDMLKEACNNYIEQIVDRNGNPPSSSYDKGKRRIDYVVERVIHDDMKKAVDTAAQQIQERLEDYVASTMQEKLTENISRAIGLEDIVKSMK